MPRAILDSILIFSSRAITGARATTVTTSRTPTHTTIRISKFNLSYISENLSYLWDPRDGSYYYSNPDGSQYYNSGDGFAKYTPPSGSGSGDGNSTNNSTDNSGSGSNK